MSIIKTITIMILVSSVIVAVFLAQSAKNIIEDKQPNVVIKTINSITATGFREMRPIPEETKYTTDGTFQASFETRNSDNMTIKEVTITDPFEEEDCLILTDNAGKKLSKTKPVTFTARCKQITTGDPYRLNINITYTQAGSDEVKQQLGTIKGTTEDLTE